MAEQKWYETTHRWCQTNLTEIDAEVCDIEFWKQYWRQNHIQGIIVNAGGIVAYYPSRFPLQYRSRYLKDRYGWTCTEEEELYLTMHIHRVKSEQQPDKDAE